MGRNFVHNEDCVCFEKNGKVADSAWQTEPVKESASSTWQTTRGNKRQLFCATAIVTTIVLLLLVVIIILVTSNLACKDSNTKTNSTKEGLLASGNKTVIGEVPEQTTQGPADGAIVTTATSLDNSETSDKNQTLPAVFERNNIARKKNITGDETKTEEATSKNNAGQKDQPEPSANITQNPKIQEPAVTTTHQSSQLVEEEDSSKDEEDSETDSLLSNNTKTSTAKKINATTKIAPTTKTSESLVKAGSDESKTNGSKVSDAYSSAKDSISPVTQTRTAEYDAEDTVETSISSSKLKETAPKRKAASKDTILEAASSRNEDLQKLQAPTRAAEKSSTSKDGLAMNRLFATKTSETGIVNKPQATKTINATIKISSNAATTTPSTVTSALKESIVADMSLEGIAPMPSKDNGTSAIVANLTILETPSATAAVDKTSSTEATIVTATSDLAEVRKLTSKNMIEAIAPETDELKPKSDFIKAAIAVAEASKNTTTATITTAASPDFKTTIAPVTTTTAIPTNVAVAIEATAKDKSRTDANKSLAT